MLLALIPVCVKKPGVQRHPLIRIYGRSWTVYHGDVYDHFSFFFFFLSVPTVNPDQWMWLAGLKTADIPLALFIYTLAKFIPTFDFGILKNGEIRYVEYTHTHTDAETHTHLQHLQCLQLWRLAAASAARCYCSLFLFHYIGSSMTWPSITRTTSTA